MGETWSTVPQREISKITTLTTLQTISNYQRFTSSSAIASPALSTLELLESDLKPEEIETRDILPSSDKTPNSTLLVDSLSQPHLASSEYFDIFYQLVFLRKAGSMIVYLLFAGSNFNK